MLEVREESVPFLAGRGPVFFSRTQGSATGDERPVRFERLCGIDGLVSHGGGDGGVSYDDLSDVRRQAIDNRVGDKDSSEIVWCEVEGIPISVGESAGREGPSEHLIDRSGVEGVFLAADGALEQ